MKRLLAICMAMVYIAVLLSGCGSVGEKGLFDEVRYSEDTAKEVYHKVSGQLEDFFQTECAYMVDASTFTTQYNYFWTEEYTLAFAEDEEQKICLWYEGKYYAEKDGKVTYTELPWEELHTEQMRKQAQELAMELLTRSYDSITFKKIPMAGENRYLLTVEYPFSAIPPEEKEAKLLDIELDSKDENGQYVNSALIRSSREVPLINASRHSFASTVKNNLP